MPQSLLSKIDGLAGGRSKFIREAVEEKVKRAGPTGKSAWVALEKTKNLNIRIPVSTSRVKRVKL